MEHGSYVGDENDSQPNSIVNDRPLSSKPVVIENNVWIGELCSVLPGVTIGENSIIGANSVVTKSIPANSITVGNPAKVIKQFNFETKHWEKVKITFSFVCVKNTQIASCEYLFFHTVGQDVCFFLFVIRKWQQFKNRGSPCQRLRDCFHHVQIL